MAFVYALDPAEPANTDLVQDGAAEIRLTKNALIERLQSFFQNVDNDPLQVKSGVTFLGNFTQSAGTAALQAVTGTTAVFSSTIQGTTITATVGFSGILTGSLVGNASTATTLQNTRTIWGQNFNGSANVSGAMTGVTSIVMAGALSGVTTLAMGGALSGVTTIATSSTINSQTISATANFTGTATFASTVTVTTGGLTVSAGTTAVQALTTTTATHTGALTYGGVTLSNAVTGTGNMVLSAGPTLTGTTLVAAITASGTITTSATGQFLTNSGATTQAVYVGLANTSGSAFFGIESSAGGVVVTGSTAYDTIIRAGGGLSISTGGGTLRTRWDSSGAITTNAGLAVSAGTTAVQALTATTAVFSSTLTATGGTATFGGVIGSAFTTNSDASRFLLRNAALTTVGHISNIKDWIGSGVNVTDLAIAAIGVMNFYVGGATSAALRITNSGSYANPAVDITSSNAVIFSGSTTVGSGVKMYFDGAGGAVGTNIYIVNNSAGRLSFQAGSAEVMRIDSGTGLTITGTASATGLCNFGTDLLIIAPATGIVQLAKTSAAIMLGSVTFGGAITNNFVFFVQNSTGTIPGTPTSGGFMYSEAGAGKWKGTSGTITTFGPADPHCPDCGMDYGHEWENEKYGYLAICMSCLAQDLGNKKYIRRTKHQH